MGLSINRLAGSVALVLVVSLLSGCGTPAIHSTTYDIPGSAEEKMDTDKYFYMTTGLKPGEWNTPGEYDPKDKPRYSAQDNSGGGGGHH